MSCAWTHTTSDAEFAEVDERNSERIWLCWGIGKS